MTIERFEEIMNDDSIETIFPDDCNVVVGLNIIRKYIPKAGIEGVEHDVIYSVDVEELVNAGITEEDTTKLREINWMINENCLACFA